MNDVERIREVARIKELAAWLVREGFVDDEPDAVLTAVQLLLVAEDGSLSDARPT